MANNNQYKLDVLGILETARKEYESNTFKSISPLMSKEQVKEINDSTARKLAIIEKLKKSINKRGKRP